jgi:pheromone shutdown-related protein TraB
MEAAADPPPLSENVTHLRYEPGLLEGETTAEDAKDIYVIGTAHISRKSVDEVREVIRAVRPDTVCVELDQIRFESLTDETRWRKLDIFQVIREKKVLLLLTSLVLGAYQRKLGEALGVKPGAEMLAAIEEAEKIGAELVLADRDIQATLKRTWRNLSIFNKSRLLGSLVASFFAAEEITEEQIEKLKERDNISEMMKELARAMPQVQVPLIDERDRYLMSSVQEAPGKTIVAVVGAGHVEGMVGYLGQEVDRAALERIPPTSWLVQSLKWIIPLVVLGAFYWGWREHSEEGLKQMLFAWILPNSVLAAVFAVIAGAKPLTILVSLIASPITSLNPTIGAGMVAGLLEAWLRRPTVEDCERVPEDSKTWRGIYRNQFTRVLVVAVLVTLGSALGGWVGATWVVSLI